MMKPLLLMGNLLMIAGCMGTTVANTGTDTPGAGGMSGDPLQELSSMHWQLQSVRNGTATPTRQLSTGIPVNRYQLDFSAGRILIQGGCNQANGSVRLPAAGTMLIGQMAVTARGCDRNLGSADAEVFSLISQVSGYQLSGQQLALFGVEGSLQLKGSPTVETKYGGEGIRKFIDIRNTAGGLLWREVRYDENAIRINPNEPWLKGDFPGIQGFTPNINNEYTVRIKEFRDASGRVVWVKDAVVMNGILGR